MRLRYYMREPGLEHPKDSNELPNRSETFERIAEALLTEPETLLPETPNALEWRYQQGYAVVVLDEDLDNEVVGFTSLRFLLAKDHPLGPWLELGNTWVKKDSHRGNGINQAMYRLLLPHHANQNILATTTSDSSIFVGEQLHFVPIPRQSLPLEVWLASCCCPQSKTHSPDSSNRGCILARGEPQHAGDTVCWFRITPETAQRLGKPISS